jgi:hypothetical protein
VPFEQAGNIRLMGTTRLRRRLARLERIQSPARDATYTLEELCRARWGENRRDFLKIARGTSLGYFVGQFEREDAERDKSARYGLPTGSRR